MNSDWTFYTVEVAPQSKVCYASITLRGMIQFTRDIGSLSDVEYVCLAYNDYTGQIAVCHANDANTKFKLSRVGKQWFSVTKSKYALRSWGLLDLYVGQELHVSEYKPDRVHVVFDLPDIPELAMEDVLRRQVHRWLAMGRLITDEFRQDIKAKYGVPEFLMRDAIQFAIDERNRNALATSEKKR